MTFELTLSAFSFLVRSSQYARMIYNIIKLKVLQYKLYTYIQHNNPTTPAKKKKLLNYT